MPDRVTHRAERTSGAQRQLFAAGVGGACALLGNKGEVALGCPCNQGVLRALAQHVRHHVLALRLAVPVIFVLCACSLLECVHWAGAREAGGRGQPGSNQFQWE